MGWHGGRDKDNQIVRVCVCVLCVWRGSKKNSAHFHQTVGYPCKTVNRRAKLSGIICVKKLGFGLIESIEGE